MHAGGVFADRAVAGRALLPLLEHLRGRDVVVLGLPRGGVPVAAQVAAGLGAPLDVLVARKLGAPRNPEYALGAIAEAGARFVDEQAAARVDPAALEAVEERERAELARRVAVYRPHAERLDLAGRAVVLVDDGIATGATTVAACRAARALGAAEVTVAVPVAPRGWTGRLEGEADALVAAREPRVFLAVGHFYADFRQTTDTEVLALLAAHPRP